MDNDHWIVTLDAVADTLIPSRGPWPAPSDLAVAADLVARLRGEERLQLQESVERLRKDGFSTRNAPERTAMLAQLEENEPLRFDELRRLVYFGYYAQPVVTRVIRALGHDINESPQPLGYQLSPFSRAEGARAPQRRSRYIPTESVGSTLERGT